MIIIMSIQLCAFSPRLMHLAGYSQACLQNFLLQHLHEGVSTVVFLQSSLLVSLQGVFLRHLYRGTFTVVYTPISTHVSKECVSLISLWRHLYSPIYISKTWTTYAHVSTKWGFASKRKCVYCQRRDSQSAIHGQDGERRHYPILVVQNSVVLWHQPRLKILIKGLLGKIVPNVPNMPNSGHSVALRDLKIVLNNLTLLCAKLNFAHNRIRLLSTIFKSRSATDTECPVLGIIDKLLKKSIFIIVHAFC